MTIEKLNQIEQCRFLLPDPALEVVGELVSELRKYIVAMDKIYRHNESSRLAVIKYLGVSHTGEIKCKQ